MKTKIYTPKELGGGITCLESLEGLHLEAAGISVPYGGWAVVNRKLPIQEGDFVQCSRMTYSYTPYILQVKQVTEEAIIVGSAFKDSAIDYSFEPAEVFGVITHIFCKRFRNELYKRIKK